MPRFLEMPTEEIKVAHFNPAKRVNRDSLTGLMLSIREHGIMKPLDLDRHQVLADGHRRRAAAMYLKMPSVPVSIHHESPLDAAALWVVLNSETMSLTPTQWLAAIDSGLPLATPGFPEILKRRVERLIELVGREGISMLVEHNRSPYIIDSADRVVKFCEMRGDEAFYKATVDWLIYVGNSFNVRTAIAEEIPTDVLIEAINGAATDAYVGYWQMMIIGESQDDTVKERIFKCQVCGGAVAQREEVYAVIRQDYPFSDAFLDEPGMQVKTYHALCSTVDETIYTLPDRKIEAIVQGLLDVPNGFVYTLNAPYAHGLRYPGDDDPGRDDRYLTEPEVEK